MIHREDRGDIAVLRLDHGKVSAIDSELLSLLLDRLDAVDASPARALVLTGSGSSFSAGVDLWRVLEGGQAYLQGFLPAFRRTVARLFTFSRPVLAAVNGHAIAGGCLLALCCDYRIMARGTGRIGLPLLRIGVPFPGISIEILRFVAGLRAHQLAYFGDTYPPERARELGLIDEVAEPEDLFDRALEVAGQLAAIPARTFQLTKRQLREPVLQRVEHQQTQFEDSVTELWNDSEIHAFVRAYMERTVGKSGRP